MTSKVTHEEMEQIAKHYNLNIYQSSAIEKYVLQNKQKETQPTLDDAIKVVIKMQIKELENPKLLPHVLDTLHNILTALKGLKEGKR